MKKTTKKYSLVITNGNAKKKIKKLKKILTIEGWLG